MNSDGVIQLRDQRLGSLASWWERQKQEGDAAISFVLFITRHPVGL